MNSRFENKLPEFYRLLRSPPEPGLSGSDWVTEPEPGPGEWLAGAGTHGNVHLITIWSLTLTPWHLLPLVQTCIGPTLICRWDSPHWRERDTSRVIQWSRALTLLHHALNIHLKYDVHKINTSKFLRLMFFLAFDQLQSMFKSFIQKSIIIQFN